MPERPRLMPPRRTATPMPLDCPEWFLAFMVDFHQMCDDVHAIRVELEARRERERPHEFEEGIPV